METVAYRWWEVQVSTWDFQGLVVAEILEMITVSGKTYLCPMSPVVYDHEPDRRMSSVMSEIRKLDHEPSMDEVNAIVDEVAPRV